jgi:hypothetical protein
LHFGDNWDKEDCNVWEDNFDNTKVDLPIDMAHHRWKFAIVEDAFNARWKAEVIFGWWLTMDKSRMPGWYKGPITQGPNPKPVRMGATMHTICVTDGPLATYNLNACMFGGKTDKDLQHGHVNITRT